MSKNAWQNRNAVFAPENQQGLRAAKALTGVISDCFIVHEMKSEIILNTAIRVACCQHLQFFASADRQFIGFLWTPPHGRKIRTKLIRDRNNYNLPPRALVLRENVFDWQPQTGEVFVPLFDSWDDILAKMTSLHVERSNIVAFEINSGVPVTIPTGTINPPRDPTSHDGYARDAAVRQWSLERAQWRCEACGVAPPFVTQSGEPYLEVHHLHRLADGGSDTPANTAALCPNCHREIHYGVDTVNMRSRLRELRESKP